MVSEAYDNPRKYFVDRRKARSMPMTNLFNDPDKWMANSVDGAHLYEIRVTGKLDPRWFHWFDGMTVSNQEGNVVVLEGRVIDQPALHGILDKIRDLNLELLSVQQK
jgi:hypothetical protein